MSTDVAPPATDGRLPARDGDAPPAGITPSQTVGPFFAYALTPGEYPFRPLIFDDLATDDVAGERIRFEGYVLDGDGEPIVDAMIEVWQADGEGRYPTGAAREGANTGFRGFGRAHVDTNGFFAFTTVKPGPVPGPDGTRQAPHLNIGIFARGLMRRLFTRAYFSDDAAAHDGDPVLQVVPSDRRATLVATRRDRAPEPPAYELVVRLQGENETVFFQD